jgi:sigma-B regulation protein RsbU (phosphoserine phosphatase)
VVGSEAADSDPTESGERISFVPGGQPADVADGVRWVFEWDSNVDLLEWSTGRHDRGTVILLFDPRIFYGQMVRSGDINVASGFLLGLTVIGVMFLTIEAVALVMGFALAKSITGAVHELFTGTERVRQGDFSHPIQVETGDQLGQLAGSFNTMTGSIAELLTQAEEKRRLEEELRIARDIQMSLLPSGPVTFPGLAVSAMCRPAREVGGDYYDFMPLGEHRLGVLVADVSGKGPSAALYMAELKGLILSLSQVYESPKRLLLELNRILSANLLDNRTFITMIYAVLDLEARTVTYVRAGHTPLIYVPADGPAPGTSQVLTPDGLVVGLHLDGIEEKFAELLEEQTLSIGEGDLFAFFTDGITEAMNEESDLFGEERLSRLLEEHAHLPSDELQERVLGDVEGFVGGAEQHDDMTIVLLRVDGLPPRGVHA